MVHGGHGERVKEMRSMKSSLTEHSDKIYYTRVIIYYINPHWLQLNKLRTI